MVVVTLLYLLLGINFVNLVSDKSTLFYKDLRFWIILVSLIVLVYMTLRSYPLQ